MISTKSVMGLLVGAAILISTALPTPALANNNNNAALNQMAMQMYMQQQTNSQTQAILAQQQAQATYNAAQAAWAAQHYSPVTTNVNYVYPNGYNSGAYAPVQNIVYHHDWHRDSQNHWRR